MAVIAIFGPTGAGKTAVAIELAGLLRERGEDPVAVSCDAIQVYRGLELLSGAADEEQRRRLEHRLVAIADPSEEFSAGRFAELARDEIDELLGSRRTPIVVGGTGLYMRAALAELDLRPPVPPEVRGRVEAEIAELGPATLHAEREAIAPADLERLDRESRQLPGWLARNGGTSEDYAFFNFATRYHYAFLGVRRADGALVGMLRTQGGL